MGYFRHGGKCYVPQKTKFLPRSALQEWPFLQITYSRNVLKDFLGVLGFLHKVRGEFTDGVLKTAVGPIFIPNDQSRWDP
jgi:hypothetical protein